MRLELTPAQRSAQETFRAFAAAEVLPQADQFDREERITPAIINRLAQQGYLATIVPAALGGRGLDMITYGLLHEAIGSACISVRSLLTVHDMVAHTIARWGTEAQRAKWLPALVSGEVIGAFGLTEPEVGSDAQRIQTTATRSGEAYSLNGCKKWITFGQIADVVLVIARYEDKPTAFLVEANSAGFSRTPITGLLGARGSMLAELHFADCQVPAANLLGRPGFGFSSIVSTALDLGRYSVAWGCVGMGQACWEMAARYAGTRQQFGKLLNQHELVQRLLTEMLTNVKAARLLCYQAGYLKDTGDPQAILETLIAKYFASRMIAQAANDAVQIHGANGCSSDYSVQRYLRDSKIMEIIEGSTQILQVNIAKYGCQEYAPAV